MSDRTERFPGEVALNAYERQLRSALAAAEAKILEYEREIGEQDDALAAAEAQVETLRDGYEMLARTVCETNLHGNCVGAVHSRRKRYDNPERHDVPGCRRHFAEKMLAALAASPTSEEGS